MTVATDYAKLLKNVGIKRDTQIELLKEGAREHGIQLLEQFFADLFAANPKLTHVFCTGYTPQWNDGEECYHSTEVFIHNDTDEQDSWSEMGDFLECKLGWEIDYDDLREEITEINAGLSKSECRDIEDQIPIDAMSEALGTNWLIVANRNCVELHEYQCGY